MLRSTSIIFCLFSIQLCLAQQQHLGPVETFDLDSLIKALIDEKKIPSIALGIVKGDQVLLAKGYGYANVEDQRAADEHTMYQLGSVTKMFTGHLLASLIEDGVLSLADTLANFFPSVMFPAPSKGPPITFKEIATHSASFPRYPKNLRRVDPDPIMGYSREQLYRGIEMVTLDSLVGVTYRYSNFGYGVLGAALEYVMDTGLAQLMDERIFSSYNMNNTSLKFLNRFQNDLAIPYLHVAPHVRTSPWDMEALSGAGNLFSNVSDLNKFMIEILSDRQVNKIQQTRYLAINDAWSYGLGCFIVDSKERNTQVIYHGGDIDGYAAELSIYPEFKLGIVILTNWGSGRVIGEVFNQIKQAMLDQFLGG